MSSIFPFARPESPRVLPTRNLAKGCDSRSLTQTRSGNPLRRSNSPKDPLHPILLGRVRRCRALTDRVVDVTPTLDGFDVAVHRSEVRAHRHDRYVAPLASRHAAISPGRWLSPRLYCWMDSKPNASASLRSSSSLATILALIWAKRVGLFGSTGAACVVG